MPFDLMLSEHGDLVFSASKDFQGVGGTAQLEQSIRTRLKIPRGSWDYDEDGVLGSMLHTLSNAHPDEIQSRANAFVLQALRTMPDIQVDSVSTSVQQNSLMVTVGYHVIGESADQDAGIANGLTISVSLGD